MKENIEEDIKIAQKFLIEKKTQNKRLIDNPYRQLFYTDEELQAIEHILSDYKKVLKENEELKRRLKATAMVFRDKTIQTYRDNEIELTSKITDLQKENEELKAENEELKTLIAHKNRYTQQLEQDLFENASNYVIPKQKITDKIDKLQREFDFYAGREHAEWQDGEFDGDVCDDLQMQIKALKELLEEEKQNEKI